MTDIALGNWLEHYQTDLPESLCSRDMDSISGFLLKVGTCMFKSA
ncbi:hypothetical protein QCD60_27210 [Pokkaliibacter sp. MBI-7]|nr:hypothetical protein [Pokkaliibacter sp. MBI-7]MDH2436225.1 hypothetical protein [Pokkaliibacter sp. MBI-7]